MQNLNDNTSISGNVDSGKSTFLGVLKSGLFDDGKGKSRLEIFNHQHEPKCKAGQIIIFPSYLEHFVRSNDEETITVAGNIKLNIK